MQQSATDPKTGHIDMDIITTGVAATSAARIREIVDCIKKVQNEFASQVNKNGVRYGNLYDFLKQKVSEGNLGDGSELLENEYRDALITLEEENVISLVGHKKKPTIRFVADH